MIDWESFEKESVNSMRIAEYSDDMKKMVFHAAKALRIVGSAAMAQLAEVSEELAAIRGLLEAELKRRELSG